MSTTPRSAHTRVWLGVFAVLAWATPGAAQQPAVAPGERVRIWPVPAVPPDTAPPVPLVGRLLSLGPDTLRVEQGHDVQAAMPRSAIARIERSIGHPHAWRNAGLAFLGTLTVGTVLAARATCPATGDFAEGRSGFCTAAYEILVVIPASGLAALLFGLGTPERFAPASLPPE